MELPLTSGNALIEGVRDLSDRHGRINGTDVHDGTAPLSVKVLKPSDRLGAIEAEHERDVLEQHLLRIATPEGARLPILPLVLAEVEDLERLAALDPHQALARRCGSRTDQGRTRSIGDPASRRPPESCPEPTKKSATRSPGCDASVRIRSMRSPGFCVS